MVNGSTRRQVVLLIGGVATAILMPGRWIRPVVEAVVVPAHAQASRPLTTTPAPTTTRTTGSATTTPTNSTSTTTTSTTSTTTPPTTTTVILSTTTTIPPTTTTVIPGPTTTVIPGPATTILPATTTVIPSPATTVIPSDIRLKRDVLRVGRLANGLPLYRFRYLWSDIVCVGVIAQEVLPVVPEAVLVDKNGFMRVDYDRLGMRMMTWEEWEHRLMVSAAA
jgi:hypothetical protein